MNYFRVKSYEDLIQYSLKKLGAPVINIEVSDEQIQDRVTDALQFYLENDLESVAEFWWLYKITKEDIENGYIKLPLDVLDLLDVMSSTGGSNLDGFGSLDDPDYMWWNNFWNNGNFASEGLFFYELSMSYISIIRRVLTALIQFSYRPTERKLYLYGFEVKEDQVICLHGNKMLDPEKDDCIWNSSFMKEYTTALIGEQWGINISKYVNVPSAAGVTLDGSGILQRYQEEKQKIEEEFINKHAEPPMFMWG